MKRRKLLKLAASLGCLVPRASSAYNSVPPNIMSSSVLILSDVNSGSGFIFVKTDYVYVVTARHVLYNVIERGNKDDLPSLIVNKIKIIGYPNNGYLTSRFEFTLDLDMLGDFCKPHQSHDIAVIKIAKVAQPAETPTKPPNIRVNYLPGVKLVQQAKDEQGGDLTLGGISFDIIKTYAEVVVGNDIILSGYPSGVGWQNLQQLDKEKYLLRRGLVAGKNDDLNTIILDCTVNHGDSGGPVWEIDRDATQIAFKLIGVAVQLVPDLIPNIEPRSGARSQLVGLANSGYSIAVPMDFVFDLVD